MDLSLTIPQLKTLFYVVDEGTTHFRKLAGALRVTPSNVTGIVDRLVQQRLINRQENPEDRRVFLLTPTRQGEILVDRLREKRTNYLSRIIEELDAEELSDLERGLTALARAVAKQEEESLASGAKMILRGTK